MFRETNASGRSLKSWLTKYGGGAGWLNLTITESELSVSLSLPPGASFFLLPRRLKSDQEQRLMRQCDLCHHILKTSITSVIVKRVWWQKAYEIQYQDTAGHLHRLELMPKKCGAFERALGLPLNE